MTMITSEVENQIVNVSKGIATIKGDVMQAVETNKNLYRRCLAAGEKLLAKASIGMDDALDEEIKTYIKGAKSAKKMMSENRKPATQIFDLVKKGFTTMENAISDTNEESVVYQLKVKRDEYAQKKHEEAEKRQREIERKARVAAQKDALTIEVKKACSDLTTAAINNTVSGMQEVFSLMTLANAERVKESIGKDIDNIDLWALLKTRMPSKPYDLTDSEYKEVYTAAFDSVFMELERSYVESVQQVQEDILLKYDSKLKELQEQKRLEEAAAAKREALAKAEAEAEKKRLEEELAAEKAKAEAREAERKRLEEEEKQAQQQRIAEEAKRREEALAAEKAKAEAQALFNNAVQTTDGNVKVKKIIRVKNNNGWLPIINTWWVREGCTLSPERLEKGFGFAKRYCEKLANSAESVIIESDDIEYIDEVKAK